MGFRSKNTKDKFKKSLSNASKNYYNSYQKNGNFEDLWKRNLGNIVKCRSIDEVLKDKNIDLPFKQFMKRDIYGLLGKYFIFCERRGSKDFVITDAYPTVLTGDMNIPLFDYFPLSPERMIIIAANGVLYAPKDVIGFNKRFLNPPIKKDDEKLIIYHIKKVYPATVEKINCEMIKNAEIGISFIDKSRINLNEHINSNEIK